MFLFKAKLSWQSYSFLSFAFISYPYMYCHVFDKWRHVLWVLYAMFDLNDAMFCEYFTPCLINDAMFCEYFTPCLINDAMFCEYFTPCLINDAMFCEYFTPCLINDAMCCFIPYWWICVCWYEYITMIYLYTNLT